MSENGFQIYYPEEHTISEQITFLGTAEKILSLEGSALHTLIFLKNVRPMIIIIPRPKSEINRNFTTIAVKKSFSQVYLPDKNLYDSYTSTSGSHIKIRGKININKILDFANLDRWTCFDIYKKAYFNYT